jgi:hypothetical protein
LRILFLMKFLPCCREKKNVTSTSQVNKAQNFLP